MVFIRTQTNKKSSIMFILGGGDWFIFLVWLVLFWVVDLGWLGLFFFGWLIWFGFFWLAWFWVGLAGLVGDWFIFWLDCWV